MPWQKDAKSILGNSEWRSFDFLRAGLGEGAGPLALPVLLRRKAWASSCQPWGLQVGRMDSAFQPRGGKGSVHWAEWFGTGLPVNTGLLPSLVLGGWSSNTAPSKDQGVDIAKN